MNSKNLIYWTCLFILLLSTVCQVYFYYQKDVAVYFYILSCLTLGSGVYGWVHFDSKERNINLTWGSRYGLIFFGPIGVPIYFVQTRGFKKAIKSGLGLALYVPFYGLFYGTWFSTGFILQQLGYYS